VFWIILTVLMLVVVTAGVAYAVYSRKVWGAKVAAWEEGGRAYGEQPTDYGRIGWAAAGAALGLWVVVTGLMTFKLVGEREVGIVYNFSGTIAGKRDKGVVTIAPWAHMEKENIGIQHEEWTFGQDNSAVSLDQQKVFANLAVNYAVDPENVLDLYRRVGRSWKDIIVDARVPQVFKEVTATYQTQDITANREKLREQTRTRLAAELSPYDIRVVDVFVTNLGFSKVYTDSIEAKQKQVQDAQRAQAKVAQVEAEARQKVALAKGEAQANVARAQGEATANRLRQRSLTPLLVQQQAIEKLNPNVQIIVCPPQTVCIPNSGVTPVQNGGG
jgi:regulator of protease activity HflC (stomatin/prohibitin superfamily)